MARQGQCCFEQQQLLRRAALMAQLVKNLPAGWEIWVQSLGWEDLLETGTAAHCSVLAWRVPQTR